MTSLQIVDDSTSTSRCTGHCCKRFNLPFTPSRLKDLARYEYLLNLFKTCDGITLAQKDGEQAFCATNTEGEALMKKYASDPVWQTEGGGRFLEIEQIAEMAVYLGEKPMSWTHASRDAASQAEYEATVKHYYTCKNLADNGDCKIYERRPKMCADYPYSQRCEYKGCTATTLSAEH